jgi:tape measure domain-containing protein
LLQAAELESASAQPGQVLAGSAEKAGQDHQRAASSLAPVTPFTSTELIDSAKRLQAFGVEADKVVETTRRLADASGATGAELSGLVTAYGQVQAKGRLQGEELLQFQERGIALQEELRKMYGMTGEEFQKALSKGQVSAKAVEVALVNLTSVGGKYANGAIAQSDTLQGRLSTLQDGIDGLARGIGTALSPAIKAVLNEAIFAINLINQLIATGARAKSLWAR